jgi:hypothetical protein
MTLRPRIPACREKGQPEGYVVTGKTRKLRVADMGLVLKTQPVRITVIWHREQLRLQTVNGN